MTLSLQKIYLWLALLILGQSAIAQQYLSFQKGFTIGANSTETISATVEDAQGNIYVAGGYYDSMDADPGVQEYWLETYFGHAGFVLKLDPQGQLLWAYSFGRYCADLKLNSNGELLIAGDYRDSTDFDPGPGTHYLAFNAVHFGYFLLSLDPNGSFNWVKPTGAGAIDFIFKPFQLNVDKDQNIVLVGELHGSYDFDPGPGIHTLPSDGDHDFFVQKLNSNGDLIWVHAFKNAAINDALALDVDAQGNIIIGGRFGGIMDFDPGSGMTLRTAAGFGWDAFVLKLTSNGNFVWVKTFGNEKNDEVKSLSCDSLGNVYFSGSFRDTIDLDPSSGQFVLNGYKMQNLVFAKLDANGDYIWAHQLGNPGKNEFQSKLIVDLEGNPILVGHIYVGLDLDPGPDTFYLPGTSDIFILRLTPTGNFKGASAIEGVAWMGVTDLGVNSNNDLIISGYFWNQIDMDPGHGTMIFTCQGIQDGFAVFLSQAYINELGAERNISSLEIYPNPSSGRIRINSDLEISYLELFDPNGNKVLESNTDKMNLSGLANGLYILRIIQDSGAVILKRIIKN